MSKVIHADRIELFIGGKKLEVADVEVRSPIDDIRAELARRDKPPRPGVFVVSPSDLSAMALIETHATPKGKEVVDDMWRLYTDSLKELVVERTKKRFAEPTFVDAAGVLAEVINEEIDAGFDFTDEQLEQIAEVLQRYEDPEKPIDLDLRRDTL